MQLLLLQMFWAISSKIPLRSKCDLLLKCPCPKDRKIPKSEHAFIVDQRTERKMAIGSVDWESSKKMAAK